MTAEPDNISLFNVDYPLANRIYMFHTKQACGIKVIIPSVDYSSEMYISYAEYEESGTKYIKCFIRRDLNRHIHTPYVILIHPDHEYFTLLAALLTKAHEYNRKCEVYNISPDTPTPKLGDKPIDYIDTYREHTRYIEYVSQDNLHIKGTTVRLKDMIPNLNDNRILSSTDAYLFYYSSTIVVSIDTKLTTLFKGSPNWIKAVKYFNKLFTESTVQIDTDSSTAEYNLRVSIPGASYNITIPLSTASVVAGITGFIVITLPDAHIAVDPSDSYLKVILHGNRVFLCSFLVNSSPSMTTLQQVLLEESFKQQQKD